MASAETPRRGRPPRFTREDLVRAIAGMLLADPTLPITMARVAEGLGTAPMSLYRYFSDREDLVVSVARHLFTDVRPPVEPDAPWQEQIRTWMRHAYTQATRVPQLVELAGTGRSPAWLAESAYLARVLARAGFTGDRALAEAVYWVATTTMGQAMIHAMAAPELETEALGVAPDALGSDDAERMARLLPHLQGIHRGEFDRIVDWTIAALEHRLEPKVSDPLHRNRRPRGGRLRR
jgi:AcrR family transcriptional regulator